MEAFTSKCIATGKIILACAMTMFAATSVLSEPREVTFADLPDPSAQAFEDPFKALGLDMLEELRTVVRLEERLSAGQVPEDAGPRLEEKLASARQVLEMNGVDIEQLLSKRWEVAGKRKAALLATNPDLDGQKVTVTGYLIPAGTDENGQAAGYLVPKVGMCSHTAAPPPNQLVRVSMPQRSSEKSLYEPVTLTGVLQPELNDTSIFLLDGEVQMFSAWRLTVNEVSSSGTADSETSLHP